MTIYSKATVLGYPIHPMLVGIPVLLYVATVAAFIAYAVGGDVRWFQVGLLANTAAILGALVAAIPGFIDWAFAIPSHTAAKRTGAMHMFANLSALGLFAANLAVHYQPWMDTLAGRGDRIGAMDPYLPLSMTVAGIALVVLAGSLGYRLVHKYHVADAKSPTPQRPGPGSARPIRH